MRLLTKYFKDTVGAFAIYFAIALMVLMMGVGIAIDLSSMQNNQTRLQDLADTMALAGAGVKTQAINPRKDAAMAYFNANASFAENLTVNDSPRISVDPSSSEVGVTLSAKYEPFLLGMFGVGDKPIVVRATSSYGKESTAPLSLGFAFDVSGSMGQRTSDGETRIEVLKKATRDLFDVLLEDDDSAGATEAALSTTYASYNTALVQSKALAHGYRHVEDDVQRFVANGGTNSTPALQYISDQIIDAQRRQPPNWSGYIIFMTDGDNNNPSSDVDTLKICRDLESEGIAVYTVAFEAPKKGQDLLRNCASDPKNFFNAANGKALRKAFKDIAKSVEQAVVRIKS